MVHLSRCVTQSDMDQANRLIDADETIHAIWKATPPDASRAACSSCLSKTIMMPCCIAYGPCFWFQDWAAHKRTLYVLGDEHIYKHFDGFWLCFPFCFIPGATHGRSMTGNISLDSIQVNTSATGSLCNACCCEAPPTVRLDVPLGHYLAHEGECCAAPDRIAFVVDDKTQAVRLIELAQGRMASKTSSVIVPTPVQINREL